MVAATQYQTQSIGALPAIAHYFEQLDLAATIDRLVLILGGRNPRHLGRDP